jgi:hypothetical protein
MRETWKAVAKNFVRVTDGTVGDEAANGKLLETQELNVSTDRFPGTDGFHAKDLKQQKRLDEMNENG